MPYSHLVDENGNLIHHRVTSLTEAKSTLDLMAFMIGYLAGQIEPTSPTTHTDAIEEAETAYYEQLNKNTAQHELPFSHREPEYR